MRRRSRWAFFPPGGSNNPRPRAILPAPRWAPESRVASPCCPRDQRFVDPSHYRVGSWDADGVDPPSSSQISIASVAAALWPASRGSCLYAKYAATTSRSCRRLSGKHRAEKACQSSPTGRSSMRAGHGISVRAPPETCLDVASPRRPHPSDSKSPQGDGRLVSAASSSRAFTFSTFGHAPLNVAEPLTEDA
jgi:hypothetical protein